MFPTLTAVVSLYGLVADPTMVERQITAMQGVLPPEAVKLIATWLQALVEGPTCTAAIWIGSRIASPEMFPEAETLPHLICSRPMFIGGANDEADQHGGA